MLKKYLYPALADKLLNNLGEPNVGNVSEVSAIAIENMMDDTIPASVSESVGADRELKSREANLLERLRKQAERKSGNATETMYLHNSSWCP
jgi:hypothetical protein